jgi:quinoprotein glucose dehydrogenase
MRLAVWIGLLTIGFFQRDSGVPADWPYYGGDAGGSRFSAARQINRTNVARLTPAWTFRTGDVSYGDAGMRKSKFEATPILFKGVLYVSTPFNRVIALDPASGKQRWSYDPHIDLKARYSESLVSRGVTAWEDRRARETAPCRRRIFLGTLDARLIAIDADTGMACSVFGDSGQVDLKRGIDIVEASQYQITSPAAIVNDILVVGSAIGDNRQVDVERGVVRAFDARTGRPLWSWDPIPRSQQSPAWKTWTSAAAAKTGAANAWSVISADAERDLVFVPTGSAAPDFYGGERVGNNLYANSVVAIRASTGKVIWHFQVVHHDLWDYDVASQPLLTTVKRNGRDVPAVVVNTKMGHVFVLHRETGKPLFPIEERTVPKSDVLGEEASPTQPFPVLPPPLHPHTLPVDQLSGDPTEVAACQEQIRGLRYEGIFTPPSLKGTIIYPGYAGGVNWGSAAADKTKSVMVVNVNQIAFWVRLIPRAEFADKRIEASRLQIEAEFTAQRGTPYGMSRAMIRSPKGNPCVPHPWGQTVAVDLNSGEIRWRTPAPTFSFGGAIITGGGLVFLAGGLDQKLRALDIDSGKELWSATLPAAAQSTPMTYQLPNGKQFVVIAAGGHGDLPVTLADYLVAYALP